MTPWTAAHQAPWSMGFSRQEYWSGVPLPSPHSKHPLPTTQKKILHMDITRWSAPKSVPQSCPTLCYFMDGNTPSFLSSMNSQSLLKIMSIEPVMPFNHLILCHPLLLPPSFFLASGSFQMNQLFASAGQITGVSVPGSSHS